MGGLFLKACVLPHSDPSVPRTGAQTVRARDVEEQWAGLRFWVSETLSRDIAWRLSVSKSSLPAIRNRTARMADSRRWPRALRIAAWKRLWIALRKRAFLRPLVQATAPPGGGSFGQRPSSVRRSTASRRCFTAGACWEFHEPALDCHRFASLREIKPRLPHRPGRLYP